MTGFHDDPEGVPDDSEDWGWPIGEFDDELPPDTEALVDYVTRDLEVLKEEPRPRLREVKAEFQHRLKIMGVEGYRSVSTATVRRLGNLYLVAYSLEDVHFRVYQKKREKS